jgi:hypothetical protein
MGYNGWCQCSRGDVEPHKQAELWSQPDPSQGDGRRVTKQQEVSDTVRKERIRIASRATEQAGTCAGPPTTWGIWLRRDTDGLSDH